MTNPIRIATRQSPLALWQAKEVQRLLTAAHPNEQFELVPISTKGDRVQTVALAKIGGKGLFIKELESALYNEEADIAVHSMKDVPAIMPEGLGIHAVLARETPFDALIAPKYGSLDALPQNAVIGTCSPRRAAQLLAKNPNFQIKQLRGNVGTRLSKLDSGEFDATLLACAGLERLGIQDRITEIISESICLPAVTQGIIGVETRNKDEGMQALLSSLNHDPSLIQMQAERAMCAELHGGCSAPIAGYATLQNNDITLTGRVIAHDGSQLLEHCETAPQSDAEALGVSVAQALLKSGARKLLDDAEAVLQS